MPAYEFRRGFCTLVLSLSVVIQGLIAVLSIIYHVQGQIFPSFCALIIVSSLHRAREYCNLIGSNRFLAGGLDSRQTAASACTCEKSVWLARLFPTLFPTGAGDFLGQRLVPVTIGNYFKHLVQYDDSRFARHPRFRFFALNTEMRHHALQTGRVYVRQRPGDGQLSLDELRDMVGRQGEAFSSRVLHFASSLRGTKQYWQRQRSRLLSMVDTLGLPTVFFTHSAADL